MINVHSHFGGKKLGTHFAQNTQIHKRYSSFVKSLAPCWFYETCMKIICAGVMRLRASFASIHNLFIIHIKSWIAQTPEESPNALKGRKIQVHS